MMWTAIFSFAAFGVGLGIVLFVCVALPMFIYIIPYRCWIDSQKLQYNIPKQLESETWIEGKSGEAVAGPGMKYLCRNCINATKLYLSWITKKPHGITKF